MQKKQLYSHLPLILQSIEVKQDMPKSRDELIRDLIIRTRTYGPTSLTNQQKCISINSLKTMDAVKMTYQARWSTMTDSEIESRELCRKQDLITMMFNLGDHILTPCQKL